MRDFVIPACIGLLMLSGGCQDGQDPPAEVATKGTPHEPGGDGPPLQPAPTTAVPSTGEPTTTDDPTTGPETTHTTDDGGGVTTEAQTTGPVAPATCGDGMIDPGEQCDDSFQHNSDSAACTSTCAKAVCGDGLLWVGEEQCDLGSSDNNNTRYGGCTESCELGPRCGDGVLQPDDEECDASVPPTEGMAPCGPNTCHFAARVAFVTAAEFSGALGGIALADKICAATAASRGFDNAGSFKAWLSDGVATPQNRFKKAAADPGYPYTLRSGVLLAVDLADLAANGPNVPLDITETGAMLPTKEFAWTNIGADGQPFSAVNHCKEWTSEVFAATARAGKISPASVAELPAWKAAHRWTSDASRSCTTSAHLYCFED